MTGPGRPFCITIDVEDHRADASMPMRVPALVDQLLAWLDDRAIRATAFVVGSLAAEHPDVVRRIAAQGHELALHNWEHVHLTTQDEDSFRAGLLRGKAVLEDLSGRPCTGFRAPTGSLVPSTMWCTDVLAEVGFHYDSSVFPAATSCSVSRERRHATVPLAVGAGRGGPVRRAAQPVQRAHGRHLPAGPPWPALALGVRLHPPAQTSCVYLHPYDIDLEETPWKVPRRAPQAVCSSWAAGAC
ncbi:MAG: polysaccharide deacetylase family protein [Acidimicrobiales bacterium]